MNKIKYIMNRKLAEPNLDERIAEAKAYAQRIVNRDVRVEDDLKMVFIMIISKYYRIPIFSKYFDDRTFDELAFEAHLIDAEQTPVAEQATDMINQNLSDAVSVAQEAWEDIDKSGVDDVELERMKKFMETGKFEGEN